MCHVWVSMCLCGLVGAKNKTPHAASGTINSLTEVMSRITLGDKVRTWSWVARFASSCPSDPAQDWCSVCGKRRGGWGEGNVGGGGKWDVRLRLKNSSELIRFYRKRQGGWAVLMSVKKRRFDLNSKMCRGRNFDEHAMPMMYNTKWLSVHTNHESFYWVCGKGRGRREAVIWST